MSTDSRADPTLFDVPSLPDRDAFIRRAEALIAPLAADAGAVVQDRATLAVAEAVYNAFGDLDARGGLSRAQLAAAVRGVCSEAEFDSRFGLFCRMGMLLPRFEKSNQQKYVFNPTSAAGLLVFERLDERGGVDELLTLLDRTRKALSAGDASREQVQASLVQARRMMTIAADHLLRLVQSSPMSELMAERAHHSHATLMNDVAQLHDQVRTAFVELDNVAFRLVVETQRYVGAREQFVGRLLDESAAAQDFSLLTPEQYLEAAMTANAERLARVFGTTVFDPPAPWLGPAVVAQGVADFRPRPVTRRRPQQPPDLQPDDDPLGKVEQRAEEARQRRERHVKVLLQGAVEADLTNRMLAAGWPGAAHLLVSVLSAHSDLTLPYRVEISDELVVDAEAAVSYLSPVTVHRLLPESETTREHDGRSG
ncbi:hypothetical protein [Micromonospora zamorensis]|uniref:hypothetical protein n=1 Tax=Micromonospora zamorensis TaxID=709883 RepID=UPI002E1748AB